MPLTLSGVSAGYGDVPVLRDLDLIVPAASVVTLLGPNGAGKTTLLRAATGLLALTSGSRMVDGVDTSRWTPSALTRRAGLAHIPEGRGVFPSLTVSENLRLFAAAAGGDSVLGIERATDAFPKLGQRLKQTAGTMSGGEQQMLALARAYVTSPRYVLLDEVSMGLAPIIVDEIFVFLRRLAAEGAALLLVEQYVTKALQVADYVYVLTRNGVTFRGEANELAGQDIFQHYV